MTCCYTVKWVRSPLMSPPSQPKPSFVSHNTTQKPYCWITIFLTGVLHQLKQFGSCAQQLLLWVFSQVCCLRTKVTNRLAEASASGSASAGCTGGAPSSSTTCTTPQRAKWVLLSTCLSLVYQSSSCVCQLTAGSCSSHTEESGYDAADRWPDETTSVQTEC